MLSASVKINALLFFTRSLRFQLRQKDLHQWHQTAISNLRGTKRAEDQSGYRQGCNFRRDKRA